VGVRTLVLWCRDWPVVALERPVGEPVAVVRANRVVATSAAARVAGVTEGLRRREAQRRCPEVTVVERDEDREARAFERLVSVLDDITPRIEVSTPGSCAFPTRGPSRYFGGDQALAQRVGELVGSRLPERAGCGVGIAEGTFAATLAAQRSLARAAATPVVVAPGATPGFVAPFPVAVLARPGPADDELVDVFVRLGLRRLADLAALPAADVLARFGVDGRLVHRLASGIDERPPHLADPPADLDQVAELDPPAERVDQAAFVAKSLADALCDALASRGLATTRVAVGVETTGGATVERLWRDEGTLSAAAIAQRMRWQLDGWLSRPGAVSRGGVRRIVLHPDEVVAATGRQQGFWGGATAADERARRGAARVQGLLGGEAVVVPEPRGGRGAGEQYRLVPIDQAGAPPPPDAPWPGRLPRPHPASVWSEPVPAELVDDAGRSIGVSGRGVPTASPARLSIDGDRWLEVEGWAGPWLVDERWWDPVAHRRRARVQVVVEGGDAHLVALEAGRWWIEATYD
jgi:protein ImuB